LDFGLGSVVGFHDSYVCAGPEMKRTWLLLLCCITLGLASFSIQYSASRPSELVKSVQSFEKVNAEFKILDEPKKFSTSVNYWASVQLLNAQIGDRQLSFAAKGQLRGGEEIGQLQRGGVYRCQLSLSPTPMGERAGFKARCGKALELVDSPEPANQIILGLRSAFLNNLNGVDSDSSGLVAGLAIGDVSRISPELQQEMKLVSLTHLTAVSGANCAIVLAMFYFVVRRLGGGRWVRLGVGLGALCGYVLLVGAQPSVLRAAVMAGAVLIGISLGRKSTPMNALALSVIVLLVADPWLAVDFGFALSVAATMGLLVLTEPIALKLEQRIPKPIAIAVGVAIAAQIFCLPILLQLQSGLATYSLPANIIASPLVAPVTILGIVACLLAWVLPGLAGALTYFASCFTWLITQIVHGFANANNTTLSWPVGSLGTALAILVVLGFALWLKSEPTKLRNLGIVILMVIFTSSLGSIGFNLVKSSQWPLRNWSVVSCDVGQGDSTVIQSQGMVAVIDVGRDDRLVDDCLQRLEISRIDLLVLTHFDMDHIGGLRGAIGGREVGLAMVSPFKDERWGATGTNLYLAKTGVPLVQVEKGMQGKLGDIAWQVLAPNRNAAEAEDSNDASIVMLWKATEFNILTMADVGEKGQMRLARDRKWWLDSQIHRVPLILKVSHHGSADQFHELIEELKPDLSLISAGQNNSYGHPTQRTLSLLASTGSSIYRTDELGSISVATREGALVLSNSPRG
jgi:competence protein ComEC